jgi:prepilin peptidase CpaA
MPALHDLLTVPRLLPLPLLLWAAWSDLVSRTIPDSASVVLAVAGLIVSAAAGPLPLALSLSIAAVTFVALALLHHAGGLGGGDVKLAASVLIGLPPIGAYRFFVITILAGGLLALLHLILRTLPAPSPAPSGAFLPRRLWRVELWRTRRPGSLPYGIAIACGGIWAVLTTTGS